MRARYSTRILALIERLLVEHQQTVVPGSLLGGALQYLGSQWPKLVRYVQNGDWPISDNLCENAIRPFVVGCKGWPFADTVAGAHASANLYSLIETCKASGLEPYRYLRTLFARLPLVRTLADYDQLMPIANKMTRVIWSMLATGQAYQKPA